MGAPPAAVNAARGAEHAPAERRAGAPHVAENAAATGAVAHAMQEGTFVMVLIRGKAWPEVFTGGVVHVIGSMASPVPEPPASSTPPAPNFCRECSKELAITPWRVQKFAEHGHWPVRCYACNTKRVASFLPVAPAEAGGLPSVGGGRPRPSRPRRRPPRRRSPRPRRAGAHCSRRPRPRRRKLVLLCGPRLPAARAPRQSRPRRAATRARCPPSPPLLLASRRCRQLASPTTDAGPWRVHCAS